MFREPDEERADGIVAPLSAFAIAETSFVHFLGDLPERGGAASADVIEHGAEDFGAFDHLIFALGASDPRPARDLLEFGLSEMERSILLMDLTTNACEFHDGPSDRAMHDAVTAAAERDQVFFHIEATFDPREKMMMLKTARILRPAGGAEGQAHGRPPCIVGA